MSTQQAPDSLSFLPPQIQSEIPTDPCSVSALTQAHASLPTPIFNHSIRVYLLATWLAAHHPTPPLPFRNVDTPDPSPINPAMLFLAAIHHDLGASPHPEHTNTPQRFEVVGADAAAAHATSHGHPASFAHKVWTAIALHTSAGIAERIDPFTRLVRVAVKLDFSAKTRMQYEGAEAYSREIEALLPRLDVERVLAGCVVAQAGEEILKERVDERTWLDSEKFPKASWPGILLRGHMMNPGAEVVNPAF